MLQRIDAASIFPNASSVQLRSQGVAEEESGDLVSMGSDAVRR